jgi:scyllo-inositol 2-dehydrogenase (NADP+)
MQLNWAIIGGGAIADDFINDLKYSKEASHTVQAVVSKHIESAKEFAEKFNIPHHYDNMDELLEKGGINAAYIATPHPLHYEECVKLLKRGIPVLCEKPMAMNERQVKEMIDTARENNVFLMEAMWIRFVPSILKVLELVENNRIGKLNSIVADMSYKAPYAEDNRYFDPELGGGSLLDLGVYGVFLATLLAGKPESIKAIAKLSSKSIDESCGMLLQYKDNSYAVLESSFIKQTEMNAYIYGDLGYIKILPTWLEEPERLELHLYEGKKTEKIPCTWEGRGFHYEIDEMARCMKSGRIDSSLYSHDMSLLICRIMDEVRQQTGIRYPADQQ